MAEDQQNRAMMLVHFGSAFRGSSDPLDGWRLDTGACEGFGPATRGLNNFSALPPDLALRPFLRPANGLRGDLALTFTLKQKCLFPSKFIKMAMPF